MILPHRTMLYLFLWLITISYHCRGNEFESCYDSENRPQRCEPLPATFSLNQLPIVNSTCGTPPNTFCKATYSISSASITNEECELTCDATNPDNSHGPEKMTDFSDGVTWWQSENGIHTPQTVSIQIDLETHVQVESILIDYKSFKPNGSYILRSEDNGNSFEPFNYFAFDCLNKYMIDPNLQAETQTLCQEFTNPAPGQVIFVPTLNRPSGNDSAPGFSKTFYEFSTATNIRLILDGHYMSDTLNESYYYYAIEDLSIVGKCQCNGHANTCTKETNDEWICGCQHNTAGAMCETCQDLYNDLKWDVAIGNKPFECKMCTCNGHADACVFNQTLFDMSGGVSGGMCTDCTDNTGGPKCDQCIEYYYPDIMLPVSSPDHCQECNCYSDGVVDNGVCQRFINASTPIGQCNCKTNVKGRTCDQCKDGYFSLMSSNMHGCQDCECNVDLSLSTTCNNITGVCNCKPNVFGDKCDTCKDGYFLSDSFTCSPCNCDLGGSLSTVCNVSNGQCDCRSGVTGQTCRELKENKFFPFIDHYIYEAEESQGLIEFSYQLPNDPNSAQYTGSGYARIVNDNNLINFGVFTPPISGVYEFVLRYKSVEILLWDSIELRLMFNETTEDNSPPSCSEHNDPSIKYYYNNLPMAQIGAAVLPICLRKGRDYSVVINGFSSGVQSVTTLDIDSMVILIKEPEGTMTLSDISIQAKYSQCILDFRNLLTRDSAKSSCEDVSFSVLTEIFNKTLDCDCDPVGALNNTCIDYGGQCHCKTPFNIDRQCGTCAAGSYIEPIDNDGCAECSCFVSGSVDPFCDQFGGACSCLSNVTGDNCDMCDPGAYNLQPGVGCEQCNCHPEGSNDSQCLPNGSCICKEGVEGDKCDICNPVNFNFPICSDCNCDPAGSTMNSSCTIDGQCFCRDKTIGDKCDTCFNGHFNLHLSNEEGCQPCYCSGVSTKCSSAKGFVSSQMVTLFESSNDWTIIPMDTVLENVPFVDGMTVIADTTTYIIAPDNYLGNKLSSYRQYLSVSVDIMSEVGGYSEGYDILIASHDHRLVANFTDMLVLDEQILTIRFIEDAGWINFDTDLPVSAYELQSTLIDLLSLEIRVSLGDSVVLSSITLNTAIQDSNNSMESISWVEQCNCESPNYTGLSCEQCADGYTRDVSGQCISCECNGNADLCDKVNGVCDSCLGNTTGEHCEVCIEGYYGDPTKNIDCVQCECPFSGANGQYSSTCQISGVNDSVCTNCSTGHTGDHCEICEAGYFGDPLGVNGVSTKCTTCKCNDNINSTDTDSCDKTTGICTKCLYNTNGSECEQCLDGYYGDPIDAKNCTDCSCNTNGSINAQCDSFGDCDCLENVTGAKCTECAPLHYNFGLETGCLPCDCDPIGSIQNQCNIITGQCTCKSNVTGTKCDQCQTGYYNFSSEGCKDCGCNLGSSNGSCDDNGICSCYYGVIGDKCDMCIENYYISDDNAQCNVCPSCYTEVQDTVNQTRDYYTILRTLINALAEQNDPTTTFEEKRQFAFSQVNGLEEDVNSLVSQYGQLYMDVDVLYNHTGQLNMSIASLVDLIEFAKTKVSPYAKLAQSAEQIVNNLKTEIYAGQDILVSIETTIYPNILNNTDYLNGIAMQSNMTLDELVEYVKTLENQADEISTLVEQATDVATNSLSTANDLLVLSEDNNNLLNIVQSAVIELSSHLSVAVQELAMFNMSAIYARMSITDIEASLPKLPSADYINSQINKTAQLKHITNTIMNSYDQQWMMFQSLWESLNNIQTQYINIQQLLNQTSDTVNQYLDNFTDTLDKANEASNKANADLLEAESILADLKNFSSATTALKAKADLALLMATDINETVNTIEEIVTASITQLTNVRTQLDELLTASLNLQSDSETLDKDSSTLVDESVSLSEQTTDLLNTFTANQTTANQLYTDVVTSIDNITNISTQAQPVLDTLYSNDIQSLPMNAITLTHTANTIVSNLETELANCPSIDEDYLSEVEEFVEYVENIINTNDIMSVYNQLSSLYTQQETDLNNLNVQIEIIDARVSRLKTIMSSLPSDCDSNV